MKNINIKELISNKTVIIGIVASIVILAASLALNAHSQEEAYGNEVIIYDYTEAERELAESVKSYLSQYLDLSEGEMSDIADIAVQNYNIVMSSDTDVITDEITEAVKKRIRSTLEALIRQPEMLTNEKLEALSSGVTEIIWSKVLEQLAQSDYAKVDEYREEYLYLSESLQTQIDTLKERKTKVSINANIIDNTEKEVEVTSEDLLAGLEDMSEEDLLAMAEKLGISVDQLNEYVEASITKSNEDISEDFEKEISKLKTELERQISNTKTTTVKGERGERGLTGKSGTDGKDGKDGVDGKTTYIAYADDAFGTNFSLVPTETSKYVGTCISTASSQPTDYAMYSNWQEYRAYVITSTTDPDTGVTTVHIN